MGSGANFQLEAEIQATLELGNVTPSFPDPLSGP